MSVNEDFDKAVEDVKKLKTQPGNDDLLEIYALFKQASVGDCNTDKPGMLDFKGKAKWEAWKNKSGMDSNAAKEAYVKKVQSLIESIGLN
ncbi:putative acyl-CoA-binding protein isoform X1 [Ctenocephalides felis]|uniref:putative acyl-CoA-binding protein isoform X1 n=1 Tax=Ctenocephalides felis TaxID=7515 RepID=UPI000E6E4AE6|nr:putative acyl-CoA-binding protein isoform X1 [Ctenocephalides felis]XP_026478179.1 putative acyl-CoA-binding protein isoform X1 [Ctenocephalides felis]